MAAKGDAAAAAQKQLLVLVQSRGNSEKAKQLLTQSGLVEEPISPSSRLEKATALLRFAVAERSRHGTKPTPRKKEAKRSRGDEKQWALVSAKVAQSVIKLYIGTAATSGVDADFVSALDLATLALSVSCQYESLVKLGDLVIENMLYQVAKKFSEIPEYTERALWIFAALHLRLWHHHTIMCSGVNQKRAHDATPFETQLQRKDRLDLDDLVVLCSFPAPQDLHTLQYTRFVISVANAGVNMLLAADRCEAILALATTLDPWINHLSRIPGVDSKLPISFSDRLFRVLWKCAATVDVQMARTSPSDSDPSLKLRSVAISFMLKCPSYSNAYIVQQIHRVGMQYEKKHAPLGTQPSTAHLHKFYIDAAVSLYTQRKPHDQESSFDWGYTNWMEHVAAVCEMQKHGYESTLEAMSALHHAMQHATASKAENLRLIEGCLSALVGCVALDYHLSTPAIQPPTEKQVLTQTLHAALIPKDRERIVAALASSSIKSEDVPWINCVKSYLSGLNIAETIATDVLVIPEACSAFLLRIARKLSTRLSACFNLAEKFPSSASEVIVMSVIALGDLLSSLRRNEDVKLGDVLTDSFMSLEGRIRRLAVTLCAKKGSSLPRDQALTWLSIMKKSTQCFQQTLADAMTDAREEISCLPSLLVDLQAIARETYVCATHFYKTQQHDLVVDSLESAFNLAENYLEHVMCDRKMAKNPKVIEAAHSSLRVDAIASLLAFSSRLQGDIEMTRKCLGHSILYSSDPSTATSGDAIDKFVAALMEEYDTSGLLTRDDSVANIVESFCTSISIGWGARGVSESNITLAIRRLRDGFDHLTTRLLDRLRIRSETDEKHNTEEGKSDGRLEGSIKIELVIWKWLWKRDQSMREDLIEAMTKVLLSLGRRKTAFFEYYLNRESLRALEFLHSAHLGLTQALDLLAVAKGADSIDFGGCYGWRGVISMEICQMAGYSRRTLLGIPTEDEQTQRVALDDIKQCISHWDGVPTSELQRSCSHVFDGYGVAVCLDAICNALSLMSHLQLETKARKLLLTIQSLHESTPIDFAAGLPNRLLQPSHSHENNADTPNYTTVKQTAQQTGDQGVALLSLVDADIGLSLTLSSAGDLPHARCYLKSAINMMDKFRASVKISSEDLQVFSAAAMREIALAMAASEVCFQEGKLDQAVREAKSALSICWKVSKKVGVVETDSDKYELPEAVRLALGKHVDQSQRTAQQVYFQAVECWSWDALLAARLILSRIAYLYAITNQPFRSSVFYAEAMALVGGVAPVATRSRPYFEFAQLQILAERTTHASAVHQLLTTIPEDLEDDQVVDASVLTQRCEVFLQHGDLCVLEGDLAGATHRYNDALSLLKKIPQRTHATNSVACGCYRRMLKVQLKAGRPDENIDILIDTLKILKRAIKKCSDQLEYALASCALVQVSMAILRSSSSKAFLPPRKLLGIMEEVFARCDHMELPYLSQDIRFTLGQVLLMMSEVDERSIDDCKYFNWGAAGFLSCYSIAGKPRDDPSKVDETRTAFFARDFTTSLEQSITDGLPNNWMAVSVTVGELSDFTISVIPTNGVTPISFYVGQVSWGEYSKELNDIVESSRTTLFGNKFDETVEWTSDRRKQWWSKRMELDDSLSTLITKLQNALGFWRALLSLTPNSLRIEASEVVVQDVSLLIHRGSKTLKTRSRWLLSAVAAEQALLTDDEIMRCIDQIAIEEDMALKGELAQQLIQTIRNAGVASGEPDATSTILILHPKLEKFPWEGIDALRTRGVTRMPSLELAIDNMALLRVTNSTSNSQSGVAHIDSSKVSFLVNPAGDLKSTQSTIEPLFQRGEAALGWRGVFGEIPDEDWMRETLQQSDLFVFCGHGSGEKYFHRDKIASLRGQGCAAALLFGCSSGHLEREGIFGPHGAVVSYLQAGSPCVLAMLWDVTDKDVDLMSKDILENWLLSGNDVNSADPSECLSLVLQRSRQLCKLKHLNGLAAICYGLPLRVLKSSDGQATKRRKLE